MDMSPVMTSLSMAAGSPEAGQATVQGDSALGSRGCWASTSLTSTIRVTSRGIIVLPCPPSGVAHADTEFGRGPGGNNMGEGAVGVTTSGPRRTSVGITALREEEVSLRPPTE
jgi:hypothetical protein